MEHQGIMLPHGLSAMRHIHQQLLQLARKCGSTIASGVVSTNDFLELHDKLEKLHHETWLAYNRPPFRKPLMSDLDEEPNLAGGDIGSVELVRRKKTGQSFDMKMIDQKSVTTPIQVQQLFVERNILNSDESPFITSLAGSCKMEKYLGFVVNCVQGPNCESQLGDLKRFPVDMARLYVAETVMGLKYLHSIGIVHGDLKPANMLISATGHIKLTGFGISKIVPVNMATEHHEESILDTFRELTDGETYGTAVYIAPEAILKEGYGKPRDWWALGIILYEFLLGVVPFDGRRLKDLFTQVLTQKLTWPEEKHDLTGDAKDLIISLLKKNPAQRLGTRGAHEVKDHPFFQNLDMDNLLSDIPQLECVATWSDNDSESNVEEDSSVVEYFEEDEEDDTSLIAVAFCFQKANEENEDMPNNERHVADAAESHDEEEDMTSTEESFEETGERLDEEEDLPNNKGNVEEAAKILDEEEDMPDNEGNVEEAAEILDEEEVMTSSEENLEEAGESLDEEEDLPNYEGNVEEADEVLPHATNTMRFIHLQLLELVRESDSTIQSGVVSSSDFLELENRLEKLLYETYSAYSPPVRKPRMSDFEELQHLATGRFGSVELVRHKKTGQSFAMKVVDRESVTTPIQVQQLFVERDILTFAESPFITSLACSFETDMYLGFVMDFVEGSNCESHLDVLKRFPLDMARLYVAETVMALKYLHSIGIVHGDLKPANMLISATGHIKFTAFEISKIGPVNMTTERHQGSILDIVREFTGGEMYGTAAYIAPEMLLHDGYGKPIDWWALGIILYEFLLGFVPFFGKSKEEMFLQVLTYELTWTEGRHNLTNDAKDLIISLLKKDPAQRLGTRGAHEVKDHPFFQNLDMNNLLSEVPLYIPELGCGETRSENESESNVEEDSALDENPDEDEENNISFTYVAFRFRKAHDRPTPLKRWSSKLNLKEGNIQVAAEFLDEEEHMTSSEENAEEAAEILVEEEVMAHNEGNVEEAAESLDGEEDMTSDEEDSEEAAQILPHGTETMSFIYRHLLQLARECVITIQSGVVSTNNFLELENKLEMLLDETRSACSPPVRKPQMSDFEEEQNLAGGDVGSVELVRHKQMGHREVESQTWTY